MGCVYLIVLYLLYFTVPIHLCESAVCTYPILLLCVRRNSTIFVLYMYVCNRFLQVLFVSHVSSHTNFILFIHKMPILILILCEFRVCTITFIVVQISIKLNYRSEQ